MKETPVPVIFKILKGEVVFMKEPAKNLIVL
jgi:hypothetical protein